jgi:GDP-4-dehydro-6-deoxy-D-mannose reductase
VRPRTDPTLARPADIPVLVGDATRLRSETGWRPAHTLDDTLRRMLDAETD